MSSAFQLFGATVDSSLVNIYINIAPQRPVKCFDNLVNKFDFNLIVSNPKGLFQCRIQCHTRNLYSVSKSKNQKTAETLVRACSIKRNCKEHAPYGILHIPQLHAHPSVILMLWLSAQLEKRGNF